jgi:G6PDH family F420-dependent oxidoreductase
MKIGFFLSCEEYGPHELVAQARRAEEAGFAGLWISDHYHPWTHSQGQSAFVWSVIGAIAQVTDRVQVGTGETCPTVRIHPAVVAQAAATSQVMLRGRFTFGVGSGEALNEHILGVHWPEAEVRLEMLAEAISVIRELWTGRQVSHRGPHYRVENARIFTLPEVPPPIYVSCTTEPDEDCVERFRHHGGGDKPVQAGAKVCFGEDRDERIRAAHHLWPNEALPGELAQIVPTPHHFEQACELVTPEMVAEKVPCGPDLDAHRKLIADYEEAGIDELYIQQIGGNHEAFFAAYEREILPYHAT